MTVDEYVAALPAGTRADAERLQTMVRAALPEAREEVRHGMPYYGRDGEMLAAFAARKDGFALYLCPRSGEDIYEGWRERLPKSAIGKGCLRFKVLERLPVGMVEELLVRVGRS